MTISVLIATRNRAELLRSTLDAIVRQDPGCGFEVVVADNASTDHTRAVVDAVARDTSVPVRYVLEATPGKSHALNRIIPIADGDLLVLTDDDVLPAPGWLRSYVSTFERTGADFAAGRILARWEAPQPRWLSPALHAVLAIADGGASSVSLSGAPSDPIMPIGANMAIRRHVIDRVGALNPSLGKLHGTLRSGEDHEFALKMFAASLRGVYEPRASVEHRVPADRLRRSYFRRWFFANGGVEAVLESDHPTTSRYLLDIPGYLWRQAATDVARLAAAALTLNPARWTAAEMRFVWFASYAWTRWTGSRKRLGPQPSANARGRRERTWGPASIEKS